MATKYFRKQFYRLDELCERWGMLLADFEPFALGDELRLGEIAGREKINKSYVSRVLRLTLLAPEIVEAILDGRHPEGVTLRVLLKGFPVEWKGQRSYRSAFSGPDLG